MKRNIQIALTSSLLTFGLIQNATANTTTVTDSVGTRNLWTFEEVLGAQKMTSRLNLEDGKGIVQTWDANGNMLTRTDSEGRVMTYTYNATNQRTSMTEASGTPEQRTTTYEYINADIDLVTTSRYPSIYADESKEVINTYDANQNIIRVTINGFDANGSPVTRAINFDHDVFGKVTSIDGPRTDINDVTTIEYYNCNTGAECGLLQRVTNALGHTSTYDRYDAAGQLLQSTNPNDVVTTYLYHPRGWLLSMTQTPPEGDARVTSYEYDNVGQLIKTTLPDGTEQNYVYDASHALREISDNVGNKITYEYDGKGNLTDQMTFDPSGTLVRSLETRYDIRNFIESINNGGSVTQMVNDAVGNLSTSIDPNENPENEYTFDALDRLNNTVDSLTNNTVNKYDVADQLSEVTAPNGATTQYEYDDLGNMTKEISPDRGTTTYTHDDAGNVIRMTDARGITSDYSYDALNRVTNLTYPQASEDVSYQYDQGANCGASIGNMCDVQDASGEQSYEYDFWGNVIRHSWRTNDIDLTMRYAYDSVNRPIQTTYPSGLVIQYQRDEIGRVIKVQRINGNSIETIADQFEYRGDGLMTRCRLGSGQIELRTYDTQGRLLTQTLDGQTIGDYAYDPNGNIVSKSNFEEQRLLEYDVLNRLTLDDHITGLTAANDRQYGYDANGNRISQQQNASPVESLEFAVNSNQLTSINNESVEFDRAGNITYLPKSAGDLNLSYNQQAQIERVERTESSNETLNTEYRYNYQRQRKIKTQDQAQSHYVYDMQGRLVATVDSTGNTYEEYVYSRVADYSPVQYRVYNDYTAPTVEAQQAIALSTQKILEPDESGQCSDVDTLASINIINDSAFGDELINNPAPTTTRTEPIGEAKINKVLVIIRDYLLNSEPVDLNTTLLNALNNSDINVSTSTTQFVFNSIANATEYVFDIASSPVALNSDVDLFRACGLTDPNQTVDNIPLDGRTLSIRVWANVDGVWQYEDYQINTAEKGQTEPSVTETYLVSDHLSTPRFGYDQNGVLRWRWESDGFAAQAPITDPDGDGDGIDVSLNIRFPGQYFDVESGLYYNWNRYYDAELGRYVSSDPIGLGGGLNTFGYVGGNPLMYSDPRGLVKGGGTTVTITSSSSSGNNRISITIPTTAQGLRNLNYSQLVAQIQRIDPAYAPPSALRPVGAGPNHREIVRLNSDLARARDAGFCGPGASNAQPMIRSEYWNRRAPEYSYPYNTFNRYDANGNLRQTTTYDQYGRRHRQFDVRDGRRSEHQHNFNYNQRYPKGQRTTDHRPISE